MLHKQEDFCHFSCKSLWESALTIISFFELCSTYVLLGCEIMTNEHILVSKVLKRILVIFRNIFLKSSFAWLVIRKKKNTWNNNIIFFCSVRFSHSIMSSSLQPHGLQHTRLPCLSPTPGAYSNWCPSHRWYHATISSSVIPFSCLQSFPASGSSQMSWFFASGGQNIGVSA